MVPTHKKRRSNRRFISQLDDFDQGMIIGNTASERQENIVASEGTNDRDFTVGTSSNNKAINENTVNVKTLERCFYERIDREMSNFVDTVEDRIQNAILTAVDNIVAPRIELAIRSINSSSGRDVTSVTANSERGEHVGINPSFENTSGNNNKLHVSNVNDETWHNILDEVNELSVPETHFDRQAHTHHSYTVLVEHVWKFCMLHYCIQMNNFQKIENSDNKDKNFYCCIKGLFRAPKCAWRNKTFCLSSTLLLLLHAWLYYLYSNYSNENIFNEFSFPTFNITSLVLSYFGFL